MPINYSISMYANPLNEEAPKRAYAKAQYSPPNSHCKLKLLILNKNNLW